jgi:hypothetical protein
MTELRPDDIWYFAYGSNLDAERKESSTTSASFHSGQRISKIEPSCPSRSQLSSAKCGAKEVE